MVCSFVLPSSIVRVPRRKYRRYELVSIRSDGTPFVFWNSVALFDTHACVGGSAVVPSLGGVCNRDLVLGEGNLGNSAVWVSRLMFALSQTVCQ